MPKLISVGLNLREVAVQSHRHNVEDCQRNDVGFEVHR